MRRSCRWVAGAGGLVVVALVAAGCTHEDPLPPLGTLETATTTTQASAEDIAFAEAETAFRNYNALQDKLYRDPDDSVLLDQLDVYATGIELDGATRLFRSLSKDDWKATGSSEMVWIKRGVSKLSDKHPSLTLRACIDGAGLGLLDENGKPVVAPGDLTVTDNTVLMSNEPDGAWRVVRTTNKLVKEC